MELREKYIDFMLENVISSNIRVQLPHPHEDGKLFWTKLGPTVYMNVELEVIEKYTRSVKFNFKFDKYEVEKIIFIPIESSPMSIKDKLYHTLTNLVIKSFNDDGRLNDIRQMYEDKKNEMFSGISNLIGKIKQIDKNYDELYENYCKKCVNNELDNRSELDYLIESFGDVGRSTRMYLKDEFIKKLKTDEEFNKKWGSEVNRLTGLLAPPKTPMEEREWNYSFDEGDEVMFAPDLPDSYFESDGDFHYPGLGKFKDYRGKKGVVTKCWSDLHAFGRGSSYMCEVKFDGLSHSTMCQFFVKYEKENG